MLSASGASRKNDWNWGCTWALKKISTTTGGGLAGVLNKEFNQALADDESVPGESEVLWRFGEPTDTGAWIVRTAYRFHIKHRPDENTIQVMLWEAGAQLFDVTVKDNTTTPLNGGRLGVLCYSQAHVTFSALSYRYE